MRLRLWTLALGAIALTVGVPAGVAAKPGCHHTVTPHGNSEAEQYSETVPGPCGNQPAGGGGSNAPGNAVPPGTLNQLQSQGAAGRNAAALAQGTTPPGSHAKGAAGSNGGNQSSGGGALSGVGNALGGNSGSDGGMGLLLPLILAGTLLAGVAYWAMRRRRAGPVA